MMHWTPVKPLHLGRSPLKMYTMICDECKFTTRDEELMNNHSCFTQQNGGRCEDYPCCGHEAGDCNGQLYGSDEAIKAQVEEAWRTGHGHCDHENGIYECSGDDDD